MILLFIFVALALFFPGSAFAHAFWFLCLAHLVVVLTVVGYALYGQVMDYFEEDEEEDCDCGDISCKECTFDPNVVCKIPAVTSGAVVACGASSSAAVGTDDDAVSDVVVALGVSASCVVSDVVVARGVSASGVASDGVVARGVSASGVVSPSVAANGDAVALCVSVPSGVSVASGVVGVVPFASVSPAVALPVADEEEDLDAADQDELDELCMYL